MDEFTAVDGAYMRTLVYRFKTLIGAQFTIVETPDTLKYGIVGKVCTVKKKSEKRGKWYVQVDSDIYELEATCWDTKILGGLYEIDPGEVVAFEALNKFKIKTVESTHKEFADFLYRHLRVRVKLDDPKATRHFLTADMADTSSYQFSVPSIYDQYRGPRNMYAGGKILSEHIYETSVSYSVDSEAVGNQFRKSHNLNPWHIFQVASLLELPLCTCGCKYQVCVHDKAAGTVKALCADCDEMLYMESGYFQEVSMGDELDRMFKRNQTNLRLYVRVRKYLSSQSKKGGN